MTAAECGHAARCTRPAGHRGHHGGFRPLELDRERLARALGIDWTWFWRETPIEELYGSVHSHLIELDHAAFAAAVADAYEREGGA